MNDEPFHKGQANHSIPLEPRELELEGDASNDVLELAFDPPTRASGVHASLPNAAAAGTTPTTVPVVAPTAGPAILPPLQELPRLAASGPYTPQATRLAHDVAPPSGLGDPDRATSALRDIGQRPRHTTGSARRAHRTSATLASSAGRSHQGPATIATGTSSSYASAWRYPLERGTWLTTLIGGVFFYIIEAVIGLSMAAGTFSYLIGAGWTLSAFMASYLATFWLRIVTHSATGQDDLPAWPDMSAVSHAALLVGSSTLIAFLPMVVARLVNASPLIIAAWAALGAFCWPMLLLQNAMFNAIAAINLVLTVRSISRTFVAYLRLVGLSALIVALIGLGRWLSAMAPVGLLVYSIVFYLGLVFMRLLGLFFRHHTQALDWNCV